MQYERLDQSKRENNDYSQISRHFVALCENRKGNNQCTLSGDLKEDTDVPVYTNLKIWLDIFKPMEQFINKCK
jgi:hypothetical protein